MVTCLLKGSRNGIQSLLEEGLTITKEMLREAQLVYPKNLVKNKYFYCTINNKTFANDINNFSLMLLTFATIFSFCLGPADSKIQNSRFSLRPAELLTLSY